MNLSISGLGTAVPRFSVTTEQTADFVRMICCENAEQEGLLRHLFANSGVRRKHFAILNGESRDGQFAQDFYSLQNAGRGPSTGQRMEAFSKLAPPLAIDAARNAMVDSGVSPTDVTHLVTVSSTGFVAPGVDMALIDALSLRQTVDRTHVGFMGCHGVFNGFKVARGCLAVQPDGCVLLCGVELNSLHFYSEWVPDKIVASALFADGAGAAICHSSPSAPWRLAASGTVRIPEAPEAITLKIGDYGFEMGLAKSLPDIIRGTLRPWLAGWLDQHGYCIEQIASWAVHPGGPKILESVEAALELPDSALDHSRAVLSNYGNMVSPTVLFVLDRMRQYDAPLPCVAIGFGPGLVAEALLFV